MASVTQTAPTSNQSLWGARIISVLAVLFLLFDGVSKVLQEAHVLAGQAQLGYSQSLTVAIGIILLVCTVLYVLPRTAILGAILLTGYLGGAVASAVRVGNSFIFPAVFGVLIWLALFLSDDRLRELILRRR